MAKTVLEHVREIALGVRLNVDPDWQEIAGIIEDAYRLVAPRTLIKKLDEA